MALRLSSPSRSSSSSLRSPAAAILLLSSALALGACANAGGVGQGGVTPQLSTESDCFASSNPNRCRLAHDKAGGYPITRGGGNGG